MDRSMQVYYGDLKRKWKQNLKNIDANPAEVTARFLGNIEGGRLFH